MSSYTEPFPQPWCCLAPYSQHVLVARLSQLGAGLSGATTAAWETSTLNPDTAEGLLTAMRDMLLHTGPPLGAIPSAAVQVRTGLSRARRAFHACGYRDVAADLPRVVAGAQQLASADDAQACALLSHAYILASHMLIKLDAVELGLIASDRAYTIATGSGDAVLITEAARNLAVLTRKAGWHRQAAEIALRGAEQLRGTDPRTRAQRGLLLMSAAYTAAKAGDKQGLAELTGQAARIAADLGDRLVVPAHGSGFGAPLVALHLVSGHNAVGDPAAAIRVARTVKIDALPNIERKARYWTDVATSYGMWNRRDDCLEALLQAERLAPQEIRARPAMRTLVQGMLASGRASAELRGLAARLNLNT